MSTKLTNEKKASNQNGTKRLVFAVLSIVLEVAFWFLLFNELNKYAVIINIISRLAAIVLVLVLYNQKITAAMRTPWIILIMSFPIFGTFMYLLIGANLKIKKMRKTIERIDKKLLPLLPDNDSAQTSLKRKDPAAANISSYIRRNTGYPVYDDSDIMYFAEAKDGLEAQLAELAKAKKFIFMEYHAIQNERSWARIRKVLEDRVNAGVEVRVFYDDMGSIGFINLDFAKDLESRGIKCCVFNPFSHGMNFFLNNRDHRKITVVDGKVGFTGGYNLADEYFGLTHPYGMWKDTGVRIEGPAVKSLTATFLEMWNASNPDCHDDFKKYLPDIPYAQKEKNAFIVPYADNPMDDIQAGEDVYINMVSKANDYCYFITPYLILSDELAHALRVAAMRGVDVRIITPGIPDKKIVYSLTRSFYAALVDSGVRIFEWTPGFCHAKMSIADGKMATCGTINLDFRSLYHHFENGCFFSNCKAVSDMKADFDRTFEECREVTEDYKNIKFSPRMLILMLLRLFSGLM